MHRVFSRLVSCALLPGLCFLTGCNDNKETGAGYMFTCALAGDPACLDPQFTDNENAAIVITSIMEGLVRLDENGMPVAAGAESYTISEDGLYYMFHLRPDCYWYASGTAAEDAEPVTAQDYVFAFQRIFDSTTNSPYTEAFSCLKNAVPIMTGAMDCTEIGVSAPDNSTVIFQLEQPNAEFLQLLAQPCAMPCNEEFFRSTNGRYGLSEEFIQCNGPFFLTKWTYDAYGNDNLIHLKKNSTYYAADQIFPSYLTFTLFHSQADASAAFAAGSSDVVLTDTFSKQYYDTKDYTMLSQRSKTLGLIFNPENETLQSENLRLALAHSIDRTSLSSSLSEDLQVAYGIIPPAAKVLGRSYRELYADKTLALPYDAEKAKALFAAAETELQLHAMNTIQILVSSQISDIDTMLAICQEWQNLFGYYIGIETVTPAEFDKRIAAGEYTIALYGITGQRNSCASVLETFSQQSELLGFESEAFNGVMEQIAGTEMLSSASELYYSAEQAIIADTVFIPLFYKNTYLIHTSDNADIGFDAFSGTADFRFAKHFSD